MFKVSKILEMLQYSNPLKLKVKAPNESNAVNIVMFH